MTSQKKITVFNADDHPILRKGISDLLIETEGLEWVGSADNGKDAMEHIRSIRPDIALLDIEMPHFTGLEVAKTLLEEGLETRFVLLTLFKDGDFLNKALAMGVKGYLIKESSEKEIIDCIHTVAEGRSYVNSSLTHHLIQQGSKKDDLSQKLSEQELNILKLIARQKTSAEIADMLFISPKTVSNHRSNISKKLDLNGEQNALLKWAIENKSLLEQLK
ncbi:MAG: response regulator transcription factor [Flavobacteriales bacterium]|nr:response regulator transcription factor [Flavobacteriales bacterium]